MSEAQESALPPAGQEPKPHTVKRNSSSKTAIGLLLILMAGIGGFSIYVYQQQRQTAQELATLHDELQQSRSEQSALPDLLEPQPVVKESLANSSDPQLTLADRPRLQ